MIAGFYNPYHRTLGGGEYYLFSMMRELTSDHSVIYFSDQQSVLQKAEAQFGIDLSKVSLRPPVFETGSIFEKNSVTRSLDTLFWYSDGSIPLSLAKKNYLIFQFPVPWVSGASISNRIKLSRFNKVIVNSHFTKQSIDNTFGVASTVLFPSIDISSYHSAKKEQLIITVGRFTQGMNMKRHDVLIQAFQQLCKKGLNNWKFVLAGGMMDEDKAYVMKLKDSVKDFPIEIKENCSRKELLDLYSKATLYWHAAGFGSDIQKNPEHAEHFGISVVEAMASGCIPFVYNAGGPAEIVTQNTGICWNTPEELLESTQSVISNNEQLLQRKEQAVLRAKDFSNEAFRYQFQQLL